MAVQLSTSYLRNSYQLIAKLSPKAPMTEREAFERASNIIYEWTKRKVSSVFPNIPYRKETLDMKRDGYELGVIWEDEEERMILRLTHIDAHVAGRVWITDAQVFHAESEYVLAVRLSVSALESITEHVPYSCPEFVRLITRNVGLERLLPVQEKPHLLETTKDVDAFLAYLENPGRNVPALLITPSAFPEEEPYDGCCIDANSAAKQLVGVAQVFRATSGEVVAYLRQQLGKWAAYDGAVRTYYPGLEFENEEYYRHPLILRDAIHRQNDEEEPNQVLDEIVEHISTYSLKRRYAWKDLGAEFYLAAHQEALRKQREAMARDAEDTQQLLDAYDEELQQAKEQCEEAFNMAAAYEQDYQLMKEAQDKSRQTIAQLRYQIERLEQQLAEAHEQIDSFVPTNGGYKDIPDWISTYYPDRLFLHARARRNLKKAVYQDVELVYKSLKLLATAYYDYRTGQKRRDDLIEALLAVDPGLSEDGAIEEEAAGQYGATYFVDYNGKRRMLERHIGKGTDHDPKKTLRIYFFWDAEEQRVVVCDLPEHLQNSRT